mmetsp:Transcript_54018/g.94855  ORF Transcript_54018/g.94855 Transcript_54018/m.94855 type:complete len:922 (-) Transcript_54018:297-3062(-)
MPTEESPKVAREIPYCILFLALGAFVCHSLVFAGNLQTAGLIGKLGDSSDGWSTVMTEMAHSLDYELDQKMLQVQKGLTDAALSVEKLLSKMDKTLTSLSEQPGKKMGLLAVSDATESNSTTDRWHADRGDLDEVALLSTSLQLVKKSQRSTVLFNFQDGLEKEHGKARNSTTEVDDLIDDLADELKEFIASLKPELLEISSWTESFATPVQIQIEEFGTTLDRVQKLFDQVMSQLNPPPDYTELIANTYNLFDATNTGEISQKDIESVAIMYGITALEGAPGKQLFLKYDTDGGGWIDIDEFSKMVQDQSIPGAVTFVLRSYAKKLSQVAGKVASARMRDEVAEGLVDYLELVCAKNKTKVSWVSDALGNGSLPVEFVADVLKELAMAVDDPNKLTEKDTGGIVVPELVKLHPDGFDKAFELVSNATFWAASGWEPREQAIAVERISGWAAADASLLQSGAGNAAAARRITEIGSRHFWAERRAALHQHMQRSSTPAGSALRLGLLGSHTAGQRLSKAAAAASVEPLISSGNPDIQRVVSSGVLAKPETLQFARWLANNASSTADGFNEVCFDVSSKSSSELDSFSTEVKKMTKYMSTFLDLTQKYSSERGINGLEKVVQQFVDDAAAQAKAAINVSLLGLAAEDHKVAREENATVWAEVSRMLSDLEDLLPAAINSLKNARAPVSSVSSFMSSVFDVMGEKAPPMMESLSKNYKTVWTIYFVLFAVITIVVLFYGFWASGWCGGPQASSDAPEGAGPLTCRDRCRLCVQACCTCCTGYEDTNLCFWSFALLAQVVILAMYMVAILVCVISGIKLFLEASCGELYILGDNLICTEGVRSMSAFLPTFWTDQDVSIDEVCLHHSLLTCGMLMDSVKTTAGMTITGSIGAAVFSFLLVIESARDHEMARWRRVIDKEIKNIH